MALHLKIYATTLAALIGIDLLWLGVLARGFYRQYLSTLMAERVNWLAVGSFYLLFALGLLVFVVLPGLQASSLRETLLRAAFFGLVTYATYDLTNLATLKDWPVVVTVVDLLWGALLSTMVGAAAFAVGSRLH